MNWRTAKLGEVATIEREQIDPRALDRAMPYVGLEHIESGGRILDARPVERGELSSTKFRFSRDHVLYGKLRPYLAKISLPDFEGICSTDILPVRPGPRINRKYLAYYLRQPHMVEYANLRTTGANLPRLSPKALADFEIPLPSLDEQERIAGILDKADAVRRKREQALALADDLLQSVFREIFSEELAGPKPNASAPLGDLVDPTRGISYGVVQRGSDDPTGVPVVRIGNIVENAFSTNNLVRVGPNLSGQYRRTILKGGEILLSIRGTVGRLAIAPDHARGFNVTREVAVIPVLPEVDVNFVHAFMMTETAQRFMNANVKGVAQRGINLRDVRELLIPQPPAEALKTYSVARQTLASMRELLINDLASSNALFASLSQRAFKGDL